MDAIFALIIEACALLMSSFGLFTLPKGAPMPIKQQ